MAADPTLIESVLTAARGVIGDPDLRDRLVPEAIDDVDPAHLQLRITLFETMGKMQRVLLGVHARKHADAAPIPESPARVEAIAAARSAIERLTPDRTVSDPLVAVLDRVPDAELAALTQEVDKIAAAQRRDLELLFAMDDRAEAKAAREAAAAAAAPTTTQDRIARMKQMQADLEERRRALEDSLKR